MGNESLLGCVRLDILSWMNVDSERCSILLRPKICKWPKNSDCGLDAVVCTDVRRAMNGKALKCFGWQWMRLCSRVDWI